MEPMNKETPETRLREQSSLKRMGILMQDSAIYGLLMAVSKFAILLILPIYTRFLSSEQYGILDTIILTGTVLTTIIIMGQDEALGRFFYDSKKDQRKNLTTSALSIIVCCGVLISAICLVFADPIVHAVFGNTEYIYEFRLIVIYAVVTTLLNFFRAVARWTFRKGTFFLLSAGPTALIFILTLLAIAVFKTGIRGAIYAQIIANSLFIVISLYQFRALIAPPSFASFINPFFKYGTPIMIMSAIGSAANVIDKSLYIKLIGDTSLGLYSMGYRYSLFMSIPLTAFWVAWGPMIFTIYKEKNANETVKMGINLFAALFGFALLCQTAFAEPIIYVLASGAYMECIVFAIPLALSLIFEAFANLTATGINITKKTYLNTVSFIIGLVVMIASAAPLVRFIGAPGIAYAVLAGRVITYIIRTAASYRVHHFRYNLLKPHLLLLFSFGLSLMIMAVTFESFTASFVFRCLIIFLFLLVAWRMFLSEKARQKLLSYLRPSSRTNRDDSPLKLLIFYHSMDQLGGAPRIYSQMASHWAAEKGYGVTILNHYGRELSLYPIDPKVKIKTACPIYRGNPGKIIRSLLSPFLLPKLIWTIIRERPDILIVNNAPYYGLLLGTAAAQITDTPLIIWKHSGVNMSSSILYKISKRLCFPKADAVVALTRGDACFSHNKYTTIIKNPYVPADPVPHNRQKIVLNVGRIVEQKSLHHLLQAWAFIHTQAPDWKLVIVGDGNMRNTMEQLAVNLNIESSVLFEGAHFNVAPYYQKASLFVMSSMHEGLPVVLIEALSYGLPLISYDCPYGPADIIEHNVNGLLVENGNKDALADAILLLINDQTLRIKFANNAPLKMSLFSMTKISEQWDRLFLDVLARTSVKNSGNARHKTS